MEQVAVPVVFSRLTWALAAALWLPGCASFGPPGQAPDAGAAAPAAAPPVAERFAVPGAPGGAAPAASGASAAPAVPAAPAPSRSDASVGRPFDDVVKGAVRQGGFLPLWRKDEKLWLEIPVGVLDQPFLFSANISSSVGERGLYASQMGPSWLASFRKIGSNQIQLVALNTDYVAGSVSMKSALEQGFSQSLLASAVIASAPHPERKSVLIDAGFLLSDIPGYATRIEAAYRLPFSLDRGNSYFEKTRATEGMSSVGTRLHYAMARLPAPPLVPAPVSVPQPSTLPDPRSLFVGYVYNFTQLPAVPMAPRRADPRLGHFSEVVTDLGSDLKYNPRQHHITRWRLEKADPRAELSEPKEPIVYWIDKNVPVAYRRSVEAGILEWNKAFERIGFKNAIVVRQQADDADWDNLDARHASVRWFVGADVGFARGPHHADPRTGEIIDADIAMSDVFGRSARRFFVEDAPHGASLAAEPPGGHAEAGHGGHSAAFCNYAKASQSELNFALDLLEARDELAPDSPEVEALVQAVIKDTITHEVGHTLGLKHNFKASTVVSARQLQDREFTEKNGISGSVMDYNAFNLPLAGEKGGSLSNTGIGPYDYWAIEYAYKPLDPATEAAELARIASRSTEPLLAYSDDPEAGGVRGNDGIDPLVNLFDLGDDPLAYYRRRLQLSRELWQRVQERTPREGEDATRQRRVLMSGFNQLLRASELVGKYVGGMYTVRDLPGTTRRAAYTPVEPARQREALRFLADGIFSVDSFHFKPRFLSGLSPDYGEFDRGGPVSIPNAVLSLQVVALDRLMSPGTASRLLDLPLYVEGRPPKGGLISLSEVYATLQASIWSELRSGRDIDRLRRNLQREHLRRIQGLLLRGSGSLPPDALSLLRLHATGLQAELRRAAGQRRLTIETRAHLQDSLSQLTEALRASMLRS